MCRNPLVRASSHRRGISNTAIHLSSCRPRRHGLCPNPNLPTHGGCVATLNRIRLRLIALHFGLMAYLLCAEGPFTDHWMRVRDDLEVHAKTESSSNLPSTFPLTKKLWWMFDICTQRPYDWLGSGTTGPLTTTSPTLTPKVPLESVLDTTCQHRPPGPHYPRARPKPCIQPSYAQSDRWPRNLPRHIPLLHRVLHVLTIALLIATHFKSCTISKRWYVSALVSRAPPCGPISRGDGQMHTLFASFGGTYIYIQPRFLFSQRLTL